MGCPRSLFLASKFPNHETRFRRSPDGSEQVHADALGDLPLHWPRLDLLERGLWLVRRVHQGLRWRGQELGGFQSLNFPACLKRTFKDLHNHGPLSGHGGGLEVGVVVARLRGPGFDSH